MHFTHVFTFVAMAMAGASALPGGSPPPPPAPPAPPRPAPPSPPGINQQTISCSSGSPYCCSATTGDKSIGTTCVGISGSSVNCAGTVTCCNNNNGKQSCGTNNFAGPIAFKNVGS